MPEGRAVDRSVDACKAFEAGFSCSQAVLTSFSSGTGLPDELANRIACGFGAGCARRTLTCGAVSAAFKRNDFFHSKCMRYVKDACDILEAMGYR